MQQREKSVFTSYTKGNINCNLHWFWLIFVEHVGQEVIFNLDGKKYQLIFSGPLDWRLRWLGDDKLTEGSGLRRSPWRDNRVFGGSASCGAFCFRFRRRWYIGPNAVRSFSRDFLS